MSSLASMPQWSSTNTPAAYKDLVTENSPMFVKAKSGDNYYLNAGYENTASSSERDMSGYIRMQGAKRVVTNLFFIPVVTVVRLVVICFFGHFWLCLPKKEAGYDLAGRATYLLKDMALVVLSPLLLVAQEVVALVGVIFPDLVRSALPWLEETMFDRGTQSENMKLYAEADIKVMLDTFVKRFKDENPEIVKGSKNENPESSSSSTSSTATSSLPSSSVKGSKNENPESSSSSTSSTATSSLPSSSVKGSKNENPESSNSSTSSIATSSLSSSSVKGSKKDENPEIVKGSKNENPESSSSSTSSTATSSLPSSLKQFTWNYNTIPSWAMGHVKEWDPMFVRVPSGSADQEELYQLNYTGAMMVVLAKDPTGKEQMLDPTLPMTKSQADHFFRHCAAVKKAERVADGEFIALINAPLYSLFKDASIYGDTDFGFNDPEYRLPKGKEKLLEKLCSLPQDTLYDEAGVFEEDKPILRQAIQEYAKKKGIILCLSKSFF